MTIYYGGPIVTINEKQPESEALAVRDGKIIALGSQDEVMHLRTPQTRVVNLQGRTLLPGLLDPHVHLIFTAFTTSHLVDVGPLNHLTFQDAMNALSKAEKETPEGKWIFGFGYDPSRYPPDYPELTARDINKVCPTHPVMVINQSGHIAYVNSQAMELAGLSAKTPDPPQGSYGRDPEGTPNGILYETPSYTPFVRFIPQPTAQQLFMDCRKVVQTWASKGITTICDASLGGFSPSDLAIFRNLAKDPMLPIRLRVSLVPDDDYPFKNGLKPGMGDDRLNFLAIKFWADGSTQGFTGAVNEPFLNTLNTGKLNYEEDDLCARMQRWHDDGWQLIIHTNGDRSSDQVLRCYEKVLKKNPRPDHRHRMDHFTVTTEEQIDKAKKLGITISHTMGHVYYWGETFRDHVLGKERAFRIHPLASDFERDLTVSLHSDSPVTPPSPLLFVQTAVTRRMRTSREVLGPEQCISVDEALKTVTLYPAYQLHLEDKVGSLEVGKLADMVLLDKNPRTVDPNTIGSISVLATYLEGKQVWSQENQVESNADS